MKIFIFLLALLLLALFLGTHAGEASTEEAMRRAANPREMLKVMQIDASQLRVFVDDRDVDEHEQESLLKLLFRLPSLSLADVDRWTQPIVDTSAMLTNPDSYRFEIYDLRGQVVDLKRISVLSELVPRLGFAEYYRVILQHDEVQSILFTRTIPRNWLAALDDGHELRETVRSQALMLKRTQIDSRPSLVFAASRLNWHPTDTSRTLKVSHDHVLLGQLGADVDRLTDVVHGSPMVGIDRECFYQTLAAVSLAEPEQLAKLGRQDFDIAKLIQRPSAAAGELYTVRGLARRAIRIKVDDADIRERFNIDHYFEIEVFVPLEKQVRFVGSQKANDEGKVFTDYPFVLCVPELPSDMQRGDDIRVPITCSGFFLKLWAYRTRFMSESESAGSQGPLQQSPLLIGPTVAVTVPDQPRESQLGLILAWTFIAALAAVWFLLWRAGVQDAVQARKLFQKHAPQDGSLDRLRDQS